MTTTATLTVLTHNVADRAGMLLIESRASTDITTYDPIDAYWDGYQQAIDPGWPAHVGTPEFEQGYDDGQALVFGDNPEVDVIEVLRRLA